MIPLDLAILLSNIESEIIHSCNTDSGSRYGPRSAGVGAVQRGNGSGYR